MVRCPRDDRVAVPSAMIRIVSSTVDLARFVWSRQRAGGYPSKTVTVGGFLSAPSSGDRIRNTILGTREANPPRVDPLLIKSLSVAGREDQATQL
jgi:hypothetical protein